LGSAEQGLAGPEQAAASWRQALAMFERLGAEEADDVRALLRPVDG
jgi:hypothetical protein